MYDRVDVSQLKNKIFSKVYRNENSIIFENSKEKYELFHDQNCCEDVYIDDVCGELSNLENAEITYAEKTTNEGNPKGEDDDSCTWTFFKFATDKGWIDVRFYGTSNGYYSEDADLYLVEKKEDEISDYSNYQPPEDLKQLIFDLKDKEGEKVVQIERIESVAKTNIFLSKLHKKQIMEVRPMENNTYLVVYTKEIEND